MRRPVYGFRNRRGGANDICLDRSSVVLDELANGHIRVESRSIVHDEVGLNRVGHPAAPYPSLGSGPSCPTDLGDPLVQDFPAEIENKIILSKNFSSADKPGGKLVTSEQALKFCYGQTDF